MASVTVTSDPTAKFETELCKEIECHTQALAKLTKLIGNRNEFQFITMEFTGTELAFSYNFASSGSESHSS